MAIKLTGKKTNFANNRPNCLKVTKHPQKVNLQKITINGVTIRTSAREAKAIRNSLKGVIANASVSEELAA